MHHNSTVLSHSAQPKNNAGGQEDAFPEYKSAALHMGRDTCRGRTEEEDKEYHAKAAAAAEKLKELIGFAIWAYQNYVGADYCRIKLELVGHRIAFWAAINAAIFNLRRMCFENDALFVDSVVSQSADYLWDAICAYTGTHTIAHHDIIKQGRKIALEDYARGGDPLCYLARPRDPKKPASIEHDFRDLLSEVPRLSKMGILPAAVTRGDRPQLPLTKKNVAIVFSALAALPLKFAVEYHLWFKVACALHDFDSGDVGLGLFKKFSTRCPEKLAASKQTPEQLWQDLKRGYDGTPVKVASLIHWAKQNGWKKPEPWDRAPVTGRPS